MKAQCGHAGGAAWPVLHHRLAKDLVGLQCILGKGRPQR
jgi:hypothetical protein